MKSLTETTSETIGTAPFKLCFAADTAIFCKRSSRTTRLSECSPITGTNSSTPSSVAFSTNHS